MSKGFGIGMAGYGHAAPSEGAFDRAADDLAAQDREAERRRLDAENAAATRAPDGEYMGAPIWGLHTGCGTRYVTATGDQWIDSFTPGVTIYEVAPSEEQLAAQRAREEAAAADFAEMEAFVASMRETGGRRARKASAAGAEVKPTSPFAALRGRF